MKIRSNTKDTKQDRAGLTPLTDAEVKEVSGGSQNPAFPGYGVGTPFGAGHTQVAHGFPGLSNADEQNGVGTGAGRMTAMNVQSR